MRSTFSLRHALVFILTLCLISVVAGAALAQDEPSSPDPVVPVFDLTGSSAEAVAEPAAVNPVVIAPAATGVTVDGPNGVITTTDPEWNVTADSVNGPVTVNLSLYGPNGYYIDEDGNVIVTGSPIYSEDLTTTSLTETASARISFSAAAFNPAAVVTSPFELLDGFRYPWQVVVTDDDGPSDPFTGVFTIDVPQVAPTLTDTVISTTPLITWEADPNVEWYAIASYVESDDVLAWFDYYPANDNSEDYGNPRYSEGICENDQCKVRPYQSVSYTSDFSAFVDGDFTAQIWVLKFDADFNEIGDWTLLTEFNVVAPDVNADPDGGSTEGRPLFSATPTEQVVDETPAGLLGLTMSVKPDYYYVFLIPGDDVEDTFDYPDGYAAEWYYVYGTNPDGSDALWPWDGEQDILYNGTWTYWIQGYISALDAYTNWTLGDTFTINADAPLAEELVFAGLYEEVGSNGALNPNPWALTATWTAADLSNVASNRPLIHIAPNMGGYSGDWLNILVYSDEEGIVYENWFNVNDANTSSDPSDEYWYCNEGFGAGAYPDTTCFFQLPDILDSANGGLVDGLTYQLYGASYGPGGFSTGGIFDFGYTDPADSPAAEFTLDGPSALEGLGVDVTGGPLALTRTVTEWWNTSYSLPLTNTYVTGEPRFFWDEEETATYIYYEIEQGGSLVGGGDWLVVDNDIWCDDGLCAFQPEDYLPNGTYSATFLYWNGGISDEATIQFVIDNDDASAPALTSTMFVYLNETLTGTTRPIFHWDHVDGNTWYMVEVQQDGAAVYESEWYRATDICVYDLTQNEYFYNVLPDWPYYEYGYNQAFSFSCQIADSFNELYIDNFNGADYTWTVWAWSASETIDESDPADFSLAIAETGAPTAIYPTDGMALTYTVDPTFYFEPGENAAWYLIYVGSDDLTAVFDWYYIGQDNRPDSLIGHSYPNESGDTTSNACYYANWDIDAGPGNADIEHDGDRCSFYLPADGLLLENGSYEWWMLAYGPAGLHENVDGGWVNMANFDVDIAAPEPVFNYYYPDGSTLVNLSYVAWEGAPGAMWYNVSIVDTASQDEIFNEWIYYEDACGAWGIPDFGYQPWQSEYCWLEIEDDSFLSEWGVFEIAVSGWGQGTSLFGGDEDNLFNATPPSELDSFTKL